jgi:hypothetical protein
MRLLLKPWHTLCHQLPKKEALARLAWRYSQMQNFCQPPARTNTSEPTFMYQHIYLYLYNLRKVLGYLSPV